jgi:hemolysin activation/secretion protein
MTVFGCYGSVFPVIPGFTSTGKDLQISGRYLVPFFPFYGNFLHHFESGFDWKYITSNFFFTGEPGIETATNSMINVTQFMLAYKLQRNWKDQVLAFSANLFASVWKDLLPHQSTSAYAALRTGSHVRYAYLRSSLNYRYELSNKSIFSSLFRGQLASNTLPTSEQYGLGGADTVRGYFEQQFIGDNALVFNLEFYFPPISVFKGISNNLLFLAFFDYAYGRNYTYFTPSLQAQNLFGIGPGIRYDIIPYLSLKMDYGFQLKGIAGDHRTGRFHFSLVVSN